LTKGHVNLDIFLIFVVHTIIMANDEKDFEEEHKNQRNLGSNGDLESARSAEKLRETAKMIDHDNKSSNFNIAHNKAEHEPATVNRDHDNPEIIDK
jgi:hypothetical protein